MTDSKQFGVWASSGRVVKPDDAKIETGWQLGEQPPHEYVNWLQSTISSKINYALRCGISDWNNETSYEIGDVVKKDGEIWLSLAGNTNSVPASGNSNWSRYSYGSSIAGLLNLSTLPAGTIDRSDLLLASRSGENVAMTASSVFKYGPVPSNTVQVNNNSTSAVAQSLSVPQMTIVGRGTSGNISALTAGSGMCWNNNKINSKRITTSQNASPVGQIEMAFWPTLNFYELTGEAQLQGSTSELRFAFQVNGAWFYNNVYYATRMRSNGAAIATTSTSGVIMNQQPENATYSSGYHPNFKLEMCITNNYVMTRSTYRRTDAENGVTILFRIPVPARPTAIRVWNSVGNINTHYMTLLGL